MPLRYRKKGRPKRSLKARVAHLEKFNRTPIQTWRDIGSDTISWAENTIGSRIFSMSRHSDLQACFDKRAMIYRSGLGTVSNDVVSMKNASAHMYQRESELSLTLRNNFFLPCDVEIIFFVYRRDAPGSSPEDYFEDARNNWFDVATMGASDEQRLLFSVPEVAGLPPMKDMIKITKRMVVRFNPGTEKKLVSTGKRGFIDSKFLSGHQSAINLKGWTHGIWLRTRGVVGDADDPPGTGQCGYTRGELNCMEYKTYKFNFVRPTERRQMHNDNLNIQGNLTVALARDPAKETVP